MSTRDSPGHEAAAVACHHRSALLLPSTVLSVLSSTSTAVSGGALKLGGGEGGDGRGGRGCTIGNRTNRVSTQGSSKESLTRDACARARECSNDADNAPVAAGNPEVKEEVRAAAVRREEMVRVVARARAAGMVVVVKEVAKAITSRKIHKEVVKAAEVVAVEEVNGQASVGVVAVDRVEVAAKEAVGAMGMVKAEVVAGAARERMDWEVGMVVAWVMPEAKEMDIETETAAGWVGLEATARTKMWRLGSMDDSRSPHPLHAPKVWPVRDAAAASGHSARTLDG